MYSRENHACCRAPDTQNVRSLVDRSLLRFGFLFSGNVNKPVVSNRIRRLIKLIQHGATEPIEVSFAPPILVT